MHGQGMRRTLRHLLGMAALHQGDPGFGHTEIDTTLQRPMRLGEKVFKCPRPGCDGIRRAVVAPTCLGVNWAHRDDPTRMRTINRQSAPADTNNLKVR
jgi:hypothetical protein